MLRILVPRNIPFAKLAPSFFFPHASRRNENTLSACSTFMSPFPDVTTVFLFSFIYPIFTAAPSPLCKDVAITVCVCVCVPPSTCTLHLPITSTTTSPRSAGIFATTLHTAAPCPSSPPPPFPPFFDAGSQLKAARGERRRGRQRERGLS